MLQKQCLYNNNTFVLARHSAIRSLEQVSF